MKNASAHAKRLASLLKSARSVVADRGEPDATPKVSDDPVTRIVMSFLEWNSTVKAAEAAHGRLMAVLVDNNDLRVSHPTQLISLIGPRYPQVDERCARLHDVLQTIFEREHLVSLAALETKSKKDVRSYLESLPGMLPYVSAQVLLISFGGHAVPVDDTLLSLLASQGVVEEGMSVEEAAGFLEKQIRADETVDAHLALRAWADENFDKATAKPARADTNGKAAKSAAKTAAKSGTKSEAKKPAAAKPAKKAPTTDAKKPAATDAKGETKSKAKTQPKTAPMAKAPTSASKGIARHR